jgi:hypothetical protein
MYVLVVSTWPQGQLLKYQMGNALQVAWNVLESIRATWETWHSVSSNSSQSLADGGSPPPSDTGGSVGPTPLQQGHGLSLKISMDHFEASIECDPVSHTGHSLILRAHDVVALMATDGSSVFAGQLAMADFMLELQGLMKRGYVQNSSNGQLLEHTGTSAPVRGIDRSLSAPVVSHPLSTFGDRHGRNPQAKDTSLTYKSSTLPSRNSHDGFSRVDLVNEKVC